ncbi:hypothetical protein ACOZ4Y_03750 [Komagataeibacter rhaeticus]
MQRRGWRTAYLRQPLAGGLATERLILHIGQRVRWARGMLQIMRRDNPMLGRGPAVGAAAVLPVGHVALPVRHSACDLPCLAAGVPVSSGRISSRPRHLAISGLCAAAHLPFHPDPVAH